MSEKTAKSKSAGKKGKKASRGDKAKPGEKKRKAMPGAPAEEKQAPDAEEVKASVSEAKVSEVSKEGAVDAPASEAEVAKEEEEQKAAGGFRAQKKAPEKKEEKKEKKVLEERIYTIPLGPVFSAARTKRANKAVRQVRNYLSRHMHSGNVKISAPLNELLWSRGMQKPPRRVKVKAIKYEDSVVAELTG